ncbi:MAG: flagellar export protein FliJ [bacterium]
MKKNKKLETMLNKVASFSKSGEVFKGFVYKDSDGYYMKIVDVTSTSQGLQFDGIYRIEKGDSRYIEIAEKPKLMKVSLKSWHYKLVKYVLRSNAPTPRNMQNGCPYFWLLIFSLLTVPFVFTGRLIYNILTFLGAYFDLFLNRMADKMLVGYQPYKAYDMYQNNRLSLFMKYKFDDEFSFLNKYIEKKYGISFNDDKWNEVLLKVRDEWEQKRQKVVHKAQKNVERENKKRMKQQKRRENFNKKIDILSDKINDLFSPKDWKTIIRATKNVVGALITLMFLFITFGLTTIISWGLMFVINFFANNLMILGYIGIGILSGVILALIVYVLTQYIRNIVDDYKLGDRHWYIDVLIYTVYNPLYYLAYGLFIVFKYGLYVPLKFIFVDVIWNVLKSIWFALVGVSGIFGEYFNASYTDYCPGIEWVDTDEDDQ